MSMLPSPDGPFNSCGVGSVSVRYSKTRPSGGVIVHLKRAITPMPGIAGSLSRMTFCFMAALEVISCVSSVWMSLSSSVLPAARTGIIRVNALIAPSKLSGWSETGYAFYFPFGRRPLRSSSGR